MKKYAVAAVTVATRGDIEFGPLREAIQSVGQYPAQRYRPLNL